MTQEYKVLDLEVWGNEEDGYEKNDFFEIGRINLEDGDNIIERLIDKEYLHESAIDLAEIDRNGGDSLYNIVEKSNGRPVYDLQLV